ARRKRRANAARIHQSYIGRRDLAQKGGQRIGKRAFSDANDFNLGRCLSEHLPSKWNDRLPLLGDELNNGIVVTEGRALILHHLDHPMDREEADGSVRAIHETRLPPRERLCLEAIKTAELWIVNQINSPIGFAICARLNDG